jgi:hypothetical protein
MVMKTRIVVIGLLMSMVAGGTIADTWHYATATTKKEARRLATASARDTARNGALCYRPARQVGECQAVEGGFRCRADTSGDPRSCWRAGWVNEYTAASTLLDTRGYTRRRWLHPVYTPPLFEPGRGVVLHNGAFSVSPPMAPTPFPAN